MPKSPEFVAWYRTQKASYIEDHGGPYGWRDHLGLSAAEFSTFERQLRRPEQHTLSFNVVDQILMSFGRPDLMQFFFADYFDG